MLTVNDELVIKLKGLGLTKTQVIVCQKILMFDKLDEIASNMCITLSSLKSHLTEIYWKLGTQNRSLNKHSLLIFLFSEILMQQKQGFVRYEVFDKNRLPAGRI